MPVMDRDVAMGGGEADDLPRTLRREREARERAQRSAFATNGVAAMTSFGPEADAGSPATVTDIRIPFRRMMVLCLKLVFAAVPALILLGSLVWLAGHLLMTYLPWLVKVQILIRVPN